ncbi:restriction endonuclease subunit S [Treponema primitia]|uniref:hypothetical protein n=1 Tax=Treponema primitia TaxID=88058 RepID=UPI00397F46BC
MLKAYKEYKASTLPWNNMIPSHWIEQRAKTMYKKENRPVQTKDDVITCFRDGIVTLRKNRRTTGFTEAVQEFGYQGIRKGDLIIHVMDAFAGAIGISDSDGKGTPVYSVCTAKGDYNNFYYAYIVREMAKTGFIQSLYRGIRERSSDFRFEVFGSQLLPLPPRPEQDQIVRFLDWKVSMINTYIKAKKKQIELLKEQKQAIINQAVTKGLNPNTPMKDSGIDWLGKIPNGWRVGRLSQQFEIILSGLDKKSYLNERQVRLCNYVDVYHNDFIIDSMKFMQATASDSEYDSVLLEEGDVIITKDSESWDDIAVPAIVDEPLINVCCGYHLAILRQKYSSKIIPMFLFYLFNARFVQIQYKLKANGVTRYSLGYQAIHDAVLLIPPLDEQKAIIEYIAIRIANIEKAIILNERQLALMQEYRVQLVSDVVTGKVDVRKVKVPEVLDERKEE